MAPPQAPPAFTRSERQAALDTVARLGAVSEWLAVQRDALPAVTAGIHRDDMQALMDAYWLAPASLTPAVGAQPTRQAALALQLAAVARDEALLREDDGTLSATDAAMAAAFARQPSMYGGSVRQLTFGGKPYGGAFALAGSTGQVLRFMPRIGWDAYPDLDTLYAHTETEWREALAADGDLPGVAIRDLDLASPDLRTGSIELGEQPFVALTAAMLGVQRQKMADVWDDFDDELLNDQGLIDRLDHLLRQFAGPDVNAILARRDDRLQKQLDNERLALAPGNVRKAWQSERRAYQHAIQAIAQRRNEAGLALDLTSMTSAAVDEALRGAGEKPRLTRELATRLHLARMRFEAADARVSYYIPGEAKAFLPDYAERGYQWVQAALHTPAAARRRTVEGHDVVVRQLTYQGTPFADLLSFGVASEGSVFRVVFYTPDAPDGRNFREFGDRAEAAREFLNHPDFRRYLLERLPARVTRLDEVIEERAIDGDFLDALYDTGAFLLANGKPTPVAGGSLDALLALPRSYHAAARVHDGLPVSGAAAGASPLDVIGVSGTRHRRSIGSTVRAGRGLNRLTATRLRIADSASAFEKRFVARDVAAGQAAPSADGVTRLGGKNYVAQDGHLYQVRFDAGTEGWRLTRPGALDSAFSGPGIARGADHRWQVRHDIGLRGGMKHGQRLAEDQRAERLRAAAAGTPQARHMTTNQLFAAHRELVRQRRISQVRTLLDNLDADARAGGNTGIVSADERALWHHALEVGAGRRAPSMPMPRRIVGGPVIMPPGPVPLLPLTPVTVPAPGGPWSAAPLAAHEWPAAVWYQVHPYSLPPAGAPYLTLAQSIERGTGARGVAVTTRPPGTTHDLLHGQRSAAPGEVVGVGIGGWVRIDLDAIRQVRTASPAPPLQMFRSTDPGTPDRFILRPPPHALDPAPRGALVLGPGTFMVGRDAPMTP